MATNWLRSKVKLRVIQCEGVALDLLPRVLVLLLVVVVVCLLLRVLVAVCHLTSVAAVTVAALRVAAVAVVVLAAALKVEQVKMRFESSALHMWRDY